ncbi:hypothetical protein FUAX_03930 [Fulvitalea axinellae]|uniref:DUF4421 domain-containing protein n=1 Tax=Fulvitalea axinellae TaxID=1182444 RepID=A0AAU9D579_9BACT|nr:hypothetical protein FUAX_03930 [Fulvitalea axinellae]
MLKNMGMEIKKLGIFVSALALALGLNCSASAQEVDTTYIERLNDKLVLRGIGFWNFSRVVLDFRKSQELESKLNYGVNNAPGLGAAVNFRNLGGAINFRIPGASSSKRGRSKGLDYRLSFYPSRVVVDLYGLYYEGMFLRRPNQGILEDLGYPEIIKFPDLKQYQIGTDFAYIFNNKKFSFRAPFVFNERQKKSAGTFLLGGTFSYYEINNGDSSILPSKALPYVSPRTSARKIWFINTGILGGYAYTYVKGNFFATAAIVPGLGYQRATFYTTDADETKLRENTLAVFFSGKLSMGYTGEKFFVSVSGFQRRNISESETKRNARISIIEEGASITAGWRLNWKNPPKIPFLKKE